LKKLNYFLKYDIFEIDWLVLAVKSQSQ